MLKSSIQLRLGQNLTMTPQLQQAIRLLQLSTLELQAEIQQTYETNPMLEREEGEDEGEEHGVAVNGESREDGLESAADSLSPDRPGVADAPPDELPVDAKWEDIYDMPTSGNRDVSERDPFENRGNEEESLHDHLLWQLRLTPMSATDQVIALALVDAIDEDGYLRESLESIHANLSSELDIDPAEVEAVLHRIQRFDPIGVGARTLSECLTVQMRQFGTEIPHRDATMQIVEHHLELLGGRDFRKLSRLTGLDDTALQEVIAFIQDLNPKPGAWISSGPPEYIIPDVHVVKSEGAWRVELNAETAPRLRINQLYANLVKRADHSADNTYMKNQLQEARWFIKSLQSRNETLLRVASAIVRQQRGFLEYGEEAMKPLVLRDIAEELEMHESTISRVTTHKYMHTPRGIYEFKFFFSSHVGTADGGTCSATAIRAMIKSLIAEENHARPLSDNKIANLLGGKGINVARRTVAKYREAMQIPPSNERKRL